MMNNNKILTVSYGTFSCTLEGFDDSFGTMKAIAEYFRDLAADDRYFGAEPPQPDAEMLARIAQKEVSRRVEAREKEGRIVLSAHEATPSSAPVADQAAAAIAAPIAQPETAPAPQEAPAAKFAPQEDVAEHAPADVANLDNDEVSDSVREGQEVAASEAVETPPVADTSHQEAIAVAPAEDYEAAAPAAEIIADATTEHSAEEFFSTPVNAPHVEEEDAMAADLSEAPQIDIPVAEAVETAPRSRVQSLADKLKRIRAVVSSAEVKSNDDAQEFDVEDAAPAQNADAFMADFMAADADEDEEDNQTEDDILAAAAADIHSAFAADDAFEDDSQDDDSVAAAVADALLAPDADTDTENSVEVTDAEVATEDDADVVADDADVVAKSSATANEMELVETFDADDLTVIHGTTTAEDEPEDIDDALDNLFGKSDMDDAVEVGDDENTSSATAPRARVMKVKRADLEAAIAEDDADIALSDADEEDLQRELNAALEEPAEEITSKHHGLSDLPKLGEGDDIDVSRLMAEADHQMQEPESLDRRKAFAHLRAAVAAKKADFSMGGMDGDEDGDEAYRSDLAEAVKPRRPVMANARTERPGTAQRMAPLRLVAEQRIDVPRSQAPVLPRRIAADAAQEAVDTGNFATFADEMGATKLPELLEAAAAYMAFVEGHDQFSRPQLMTKVRQVEMSDFSREDGLRSFGMLLRQGKIKKIKGGRFKASESIGFKPDERAAS